MCDKLEKGCEIQDLYINLCISGSESIKSNPEVFLGKGALEICSKFTGEHPR